MIGLNEIKDAITRKLDKELPDIKVVTEDVEQAQPKPGTGAESLFPFFYVQLIPIGMTPEMGMREAERSILVDITYMEQSRSSNAAMYAVLDRLQVSIGYVLDVSDRHITIEQYNTTIADDLAHLTFYLVFTDVLPAEPEGLEMFGEIDIGF